MATADGTFDLVIPEEISDISDMGIENLTNIEQITVNVAEGSKAEIYLQQFIYVHYTIYIVQKEEDKDSTSAADDTKKDPAKTTESTDKDSAFDMKDANKDSLTEDKQLPKKGETYEAGQYTYQITAPGEVMFTGVNQKKIKTLKIPDKVEISGYTYYVTSIGKNAMKACSKLQTVVIGKRVEQIGADAFRNCKQLKKVTIGAGVKTIDAGVFCGDKKLKRIIFKGSKVKKVGKKALNGVPRKVRITAPKKSVPKYKKLLNAAK